MARGWESKAVADQIEAQESRRPHPSSELSPQVRQRQERLQSLRLSRSRLLQQLDQAKHPSHRSVLQSGLRAIEAEIDQLLADS
jgi:uncharacterized coiled-coil DUF342 family protein